MINALSELCDTLYDLYDTLPEVPPLWTILLGFMFVFPYYDYYVGCIKKYSDLQPTEFNSQSDYCYDKKHDLIMLPICLILIACIYLPSYIRQIYRN